MSFDAAIRENVEPVTGVLIQPAASSSSAATAIVSSIVTAPASESTIVLSERAMQQLSSEEVPLIQIAHIAQSALELPRELLQLIGGYVDDFTDYYRYVQALNLHNTESGSTQELIPLVTCAKYNDPYRTALVRDFLASPLDQRSPKDMEALLEARENPISIDIQNYPFSAEILRERFEILKNMCPNIQSISFSFQDANEETAHLHEIISMFARVEHLQKLAIGRTFQDAPTQAILDAIVQCEGLTCLDLSAFHIDSIGLHFLLPKFPKLKELNLSNYLGEVSVLNDVRTCTKLERLNLSHTNVCVLHLPPSIRSLDLSHCMHLSESNNNLESYPQLTSLNLSHTRCSTVMLDRILDTLPNLVSIHVEECPLLSDQMVRRVQTYLEQQFLAPSTDIVELDLSNAPLSEARLIEIFSSVPNLETLHISGIKHCTLRVLETIATKCKKLKAIHFGTYELLKAQYSYLFSMIDTLEVCTSKKYSFDSMIETYKQLRALRYKNEAVFDFSGRYAFAKKEFEYVILQAPQLQTLVLHEGWKKDAISPIHTLCSCKELTRLTAPDLCDGELVTILTELPKLKAFNLSGCSALSENALLALAEKKSLQELDLSGTKLTDKALLAIVTALANLRIVSLSNCSLLSSEGLRVLQQCKELRDLNIEGQKITDSVLQGLIQQVRKLECIDLSGCRQVHDFSVLKALPKLRALNVARTKISDTHLEALAPVLKQLTHANFADCLHIGEKGFRFLNETCSALCCLDLSKTEISKLSWLSNLLPRLLVLQLKGCVDIEDKEFFELQQCSSLMTLEISGTSMTCDVLDAIVSRLTKIETVVFREVIVPRVWAEAMHKKHEGIEFKFSTEMMTEDSQSQNNKGWD